MARTGTRGQAGTPARRLALKGFTEVTALLLQRYSARELYEQAQQGDLDIPHLEIFDQPDLKVILRGMSHLVSGYAKVGKSELLFSWCVSWAAQGHRVAYYSEEPKGIWVVRICTLADAPRGLSKGPLEEEKKRPRFSFVATTEVSEQEL